MFTVNQLNKIDDRLRRGETPARIAKDFGMSHSQFRYALITSGKKCGVYRKLEDIVPLDRSPDDDLDAAAHTDDPVETAA